MLPNQYAAVDTSGSYIAVAGKTGVAHYSLASRKWKLFGNVSQVRCLADSVTLRFIINGGGLQRF